MEKVEFWNSFTKRFKDFLGFADFLAFGNGEFILVQTTSSSNMSSRRKKILTNAEAHKWVLNGGAIVLHGWSQKEKGGRWQLKEEVLVP